ncbi:MAG: M20/M25/M40 family metallo-hydrolase [Ardenticatenaceae bacterium]
MNELNVVSLTKKLVGMYSVSAQSNVEVCDYIEGWLKSEGFAIERLEYEDENGVLKANLVAKLGDGTGGVAFCSHCDTVPGEGWDAFNPVVKDGRLHGRGSCDMKGPLAATMVAAATIDAAKLIQPVYIVVTADEEVTLEGARFVAEHSETLRASRPQYGVIAEPTRLIPVYGHKGYARIFTTAYGKAAHSSSGKGVSATFRVAPFMAEMAALAEQFETDESYMNHEFSPPTNGFNMVVNDGNSALNVTAAKTEVGVSFRVMPNSRGEELLAKILETAEKYGLETDSQYDAPLYTSLDSQIIKTACAVTGIPSPEVVSYGTDGIHLQSCIDELVILGPGDIGLAHTVRESIPLDELERSVDLYREIIEKLCM